MHVHWTLHLRIQNEHHDADHVVERGFSRHTLYVLFLLLKKSPVRYAVGSNVELDHLHFDLSIPGHGRDRLNQLQSF